MDYPSGLDLLSKLPLLFIFFLMIEGNQSISRKERMDYPSGLDLLSKLPLDIIHIILALVPIRDAVRTSVLSRQWRYTWASLPQLVFEYKYGSYGIRKISKFVKHLKKSINHALFHHKGPIHKFKISVPISRRRRSLNIDEWILCLSRNDIKELTLHIPIQVPSSIYSCEKLTHLQLGNCKLHPPPSTFKGFLFLRCLYLENVCLSPNGIESLVANSPLLERLELCNVSGDLESRIRAPNLKYLNLRGDYEELCVYAPLLADMSVALYEQTLRFDHDQQKSSVCNYANFMGGFTNLEKLTGSYYFTKYLSMGIESCHHTLVFHHLKDIELFLVDFKDKKVMSVVARLIAGAPNLEKLSGSGYFTKTDFASEAHYPSSRDFGFASNCTFEKLRVVKMWYLCGRPLELVFLKFLLERSPVLETMRVSILRDLSEEKKQNFTAEFLAFRPASPNAKLSLTQFP